MIEAQWGAKASADGPRGLRSILRKGAPLHHILQADGMCLDQLQAAADGEAP